jgi:hypothetical protein
MPTPAPSVDGFKVVHAGVGVRSREASGIEAVPNLLELLAGEVQPSSYFLDGDIAGLHRKPDRRSLWRTTFPPHHLASQQKSFTRIVLQRKSEL